MTNEPVRISSLPFDIEKLVSLYRDPTGLFSLGLTIPHRNISLIERYGDHNPFILNSLHTFLDSIFSLGINAGNYEIHVGSDKKAHAGIGGRRSDGYLINLFYPDDMDVADAVMEMVKYIRGIKESFIEKLNAIKVNNEGRQ